MAVGGCFGKRLPAGATAGIETSAPEAMSVRHEATRAVLVRCFCAA